MTTAKTETHKIFNDPIHGHIELPELCVKIIDTPEFQRLRHIKQLGANYKVYPGASHNRFEHSLGVCHLAGKFVQRLRAVQRELFEARPQLKTLDFEISDKDILCLQVAGLCHDLGHGPLSHVFETYFIQKIPSKDDIAEKWTHEKATCDLLDHLWKDIKGYKCGSETIEETDLGFIKELIHKSDMSAEDRKMKTGRSSEKDFLYESAEDRKMKTGRSSEKDFLYESAEDRKMKTGRSSEKDFLYEIISNDENCVDVDKWDYFARDCYHLGFKNNFDHNRLIQFSRLIKVKERWHICYRDKEVENMYHMFYSRVILHKRACLHKTTKIIEIMYMEALEKVNKYLKIKGADGKEMKISDCIHDPVAYCKLTDNIFDRIRYMGEQSSTVTVEGTAASQHSGDLDEKIRAFKQAIQILNDIEKRKIYKLVGEAIPKEPKQKFRKEELKVEEEIWEIDKNLSREDILINILKFSYGGGDNPVDKVYFYMKSDPDHADYIKRESVSHLLPTIYCEQVVRMYSRKQLNEEETKQYRTCFETWCEQNQMQKKMTTLCAS